MKTAIGVGWTHPRHLALLSDATIAVLFIVSRVMLMCGVLPAALDWLVIALIPKPKGGERPIGIDPSPLRSMSKFIRSTYGERWAELHDRPYMFGKKGRSAQACLWGKSVMAEFAVYTGQPAAASLLDIAKAFHSVDHHFLVMQAVRHGFDWGYYGV